MLNFHFSWEVYYSKYTDFLQTDLPVMAGKSLGNLTLGTHISTIKNWVLQTFLTSKTGKLLFTEKDSCLKFDVERTDIFSLSYQYKDGLIGFTVDIFSGNIIEISCGEGYTGLFLNKIGIGTTLQEIKDSDLEFHYNSDGGIILSHHKEAQGFYIDVSMVENYYEFDTFDDLPEDFVVQRMGVFSQYVGDFDVYSYYYAPYIYKDWVPLKKNNR